MTPQLIGRAHAAGVLRADIARAVHSHGGLVLVTGEAGIGKTTLITDAMEHARTSGALVLSGSCWDSGAAPGYWPWLQVIRALRRQLPTGNWTEGPLALLLGEAPDGVVAGDFELYDAVTNVLVAASHDQPVVVALDDLHWADPASVKLLEFVTQHTWFERLLLIGTYRDVEVETVDHPLAPMLLALQSKASTVTLTGLDRDEVGELMARTAGTEPDAELLSEVHQRTGGNPFFVEQTARLWRGGNPITAVAPGVRDAVRRRVSQLPAPVTQLLTGASVLGREFHRQVLAATTAQPAAQVDRLLGQAGAVRLVTPRGDGRFVFAHDLVRETLYESLPEAEARARHAAVVRALERAPALAERIFAADLARHARMAGDEIPAAMALELHEAAGMEARRGIAFEEAVGHLRRAAEVADEVDLPRRVRIGIELGNALHHLDDEAGALAEFERCADIAVALESPDPLARLTLNVYGYEGNPEPLKARLVRETYRRLIADPGQRTIDQLMRDLTMHLVSHARSDGDDDTLSVSLWALHDSLWGAGNAAERAGITEELVQVARRTSDAEMEQFATSLSWVAALEQGDPRFADRLNAFVAMVERSPHPMTEAGAKIDQGIIAAFRGQFDLADRFEAEAVETSPPQAGHTHFEFMVHQVRWARLMLQGRFDELGDVRAGARAVKHPFPVILEGITAVARGELDVAVRCVDELAGRVIPSSMAPMWLRLRAQVAAGTREARRCAEVRAALEPVAGQWLVSLYGCDIGGVGAHWLGGLDAAVGRWDEAVEWFTAARRSADLLGARPWSIESRIGLAGALRGRGGAGDREAAAALLEEAAREAKLIDLRHIDAPESTVDVGATGEPEFRYTGEVWSLSLAGRTVHVPDAKGLRDLHTLLSAPHNDIPAVRLLDPAGGAEVEAASRLGGDDVLDDEARARYRRRLAQLDEEIDLASVRGADDKAAALDREREALLTELRTAAGLGGRARRLGDEAERARKTVTARIRDTLRKLADRHPELAEHLRASISTGANCVYHPDTALGWRL